MPLPFLKRTSSIRHEASRSQNLRNESVETRFRWLMEFPFFCIFQFVLGAGLWLVNSRLRYDQRKKGHIVKSADLGAYVRFSKRETKRLGNTWRAMFIVAKTVWSILLGPNIQRVGSSPFSVWIWSRKIIKQIDIKDIHGVFLFLKI